MKITNKPQKPQDTREIIIIIIIQSLLYRRWQEKSAGENRTH